MLQAAPFQYERSIGNNIFPLACLFDSLVRVSRRVKAPHIQCANIEFTENQGLTGFEAVAPRFISAQITKPNFCTRYHQR